MNPAEKELAHLGELTAFSGVFLPLPKGSKGCLLPNWQRISLRETQSADYQAELLARVSVGGNIAVLLGPPSASLCAVDIDTDGEVEPFLACNPSLLESLRTRGAKGCQIFTFIRGNYPERIIRSGLKTNGKAAAEWRGGGGYSLIFGVHPETKKPYERLVDEPALVINWSDIIWPKHWEMPFDDRQGGSCNRVGPAKFVSPFFSAVDWRLSKRILAYISTLPEAVSGQGGHPTTLTCLHKLRYGFALSDEDLRHFAEQYNDLKCRPKWSKSELEHKVAEAIDKPFDKEWSYLLKEDPELSRSEKDLRRKLEQAATDIHHRGQRGHLLEQAKADGIADDDPKPPPYLPAGDSPEGYLSRGICDSDILLGEGFLERGSAALLAGPSGIGKSSIAMQMGCCWSCGRRAFDFVPPRPMRIVMMQNEDSPNDLVRQSEALRFLGLDQELIRQNFWIETVRGKIGPDAVKVMDELVRWHRADLLFLNPITAYHEGDISQNKDNVKFLYGAIGNLLAEFRIGLFGFHHKGKPPKDKGKGHSEDVYFQVMYDILGGSVLTNFFRGIITVSPIGDSGVFRFTVAKRFEESGWPLHSTFHRWHEDRNRRLWVPASVAEVDGAKKTSGKNLQDLRKLVPVTGVIARAVLENEAAKSGFKQREYRALITEACTDSTPDDLRIYEWTFYNLKGAPKLAYSRSEQPADQTAQAVKEAKRSRRSQSSSKIQSSSVADEDCDSN